MVQSGCVSAKVQIEMGLPLSSLLGHHSGQDEEGKKAILGPRGQKNPNRSLLLCFRSTLSDWDSDVGTTHINYFQPFQC